MRTVVQLDSKDLQRIVAERFDVPLSKVHLVCRQDGYEYFTNEASGFVPYCEVERSDDKSQ